MVEYDIQIGERGAHIDAGEGCAKKVCDVVEIGSGCDNAVHHDHWQWACECIGQDRY